MSNIFVFDPTTFKLAYPQFKNFTDEQLEWFFEEVEGTVLDNSETSCLSVKLRKKLFYWLVAHQAELQGRINSGNSSLVGRVSTATQGTVSISTDFTSSPTAMSQWLNQTPYGQKYYAFTSPYRSVLLIGGKYPMPVNRSRWFTRFY